MGKRTQDKPTTRRKLSRFGCRNCKLRKIKCDQSQPECTQCRSFQVVCNFRYGIGDLQPAVQGSNPSASSLSKVFHRLALQRPTLGSPVPDAGIWTCSGAQFYQLNSSDHELFRRFHLRTMPTLGAPDVVSVYKNHVLRLAFIYPPLMHGLLAVAAAHGRYLEGDSNTLHQSEVSHSYRCIRLLRTWLSGAELEGVELLDDGQRDAVWATAVVLSILSFSAIRVSNSDEAWPLGSHDDSALAWLQLKMNDKPLWRLADPTRPGSAFRTVFKNIVPEGGHEMLPQRGIGGMSPELVDLRQMKERSSQLNSPYYRLAVGLARLESMPKGSVSPGIIFQTITDDVPQLLSLLQEKDVVALGLLRQWYDVSRQHVWWIDCRARYEVLAIDRYIKQSRVNNEEIRAITFGI